MNIVFNLLLDGATKLFPARIRKTKAFVWIGVIIAIAASFVLTYGKWLRNSGGQP
ncbi:MAG: hypothetical protein AAGD13_15335 [Pseudomonadota bacterium]